MKNLTIITTLLVAGFVGLIFGVVTTSPVKAADSQDRILGRLCDRSGSDIGVECDKSEAGDNAKNLAGQVVNIATWIAGVVSVIVIIIGGMMYVFSGGNPEQTARARNAVIYALVGVVVAFAANVIVGFVFKEAEDTTPGTSVGVVLSSERG